MYLLMIGPAFACMHVPVYEMNYIEIVCSIKRIINSTCMHAWMKFVSQSSNLLDKDFILVTFCYKIICLISYTLYSISVMHYMSSIFHYNEHNNTANLEYIWMYMQFETLQELK